MSEPHRSRWSDEQLEAFHREFKEHRQDFLDHKKDEEEERRQQQDIYDALFRQEDKERNVAPGLVQLLVKTAANVETLRIAADRQKTFIGGVLFAITAIWFFLTDIGPVLAEKLRRLF